MSGHVRSHRLAIQVKTDRALLVGAVGLDSGLLQSLEHFAPGMPVDISRPHGNDRIARMNGRKQIGGGSARAAVVRDLQKRCLRVLLHDAPFRGPLRISLEQGGCPAIGGRKHQAVVVWPH